MRSLWCLGLFLCLAVIAAPAAIGQEAEKTARIGYVWIGSRGSDASVEGLRQGFSDKGYVIRRDLVLEERYADGVSERLPAIIAELIALPVDMLMTPGTLTSRAARRATSTLPIVSVSGDPVATGLAASLAHPGGNLTGLSLLSVEYGVKWVELLKEAVSTAHRVGVLMDPENGGLQIERLRQAAPRLGIELAAFSAQPRDLDHSLAALASGGIDGVVVTDDPLLATIERQLVEFAAAHRLPAIYGFSDAVRQGGLMSYSTNFFEVWRRAAGYADRILKGARPADLPIEQSTDFALRVNLKTAKALGIEIPGWLLSRADEVIE